MRDALVHRHEVTRCRARSPEALAYMPSVLDLFAIRRSQTTEVEIRLFLPYLRSGDRASHAVGQDRLKLWHICQAFLTCLRTTGTCARFSGDRKLQALIGSIDIKVLTDLEKRRDAFSIDIKVPMDLKRTRLCIQSRFPNAPPPANPRRVSLARSNIRKATPLQVRKDLHVYSVPDREEP